jgi:aldose 1-epimerase
MLSLNEGVSSLVIAPEHGAGLLGWMLDRTPLLRRAVPGAAVAGNPHVMGCFPMLPYCNRIAGGRFIWAGNEYRLRHNFGDNPHTIHGLGWQRAWTLTSIAPREATLTLDHQPDADWPFAFQAHVTYALAESALTVTLSLTSRHPAPAPAGIGLHPFFPKANDPSLRFDAVGVWHNGADALPDRHGPPPADWVHTMPLSVLDSRLDNCFTGWNGTADIAAGPASLRIEASGAFHCLQVFTPSWADFFCAEPVSHAPDAISRPDLPDGQVMVSLPPGGTLTGTIRLTPTAR